MLKIIWFFLWTQCTGINHREYRYPLVTLINEQSKTGLGPICPLAVFVSNAITISPLYTLVSVVSPRLSSWPSTLNSSKTEFLLIGLKQQLSKIHNSSLTTTHSARNLGFIFDEHLTFSDKISALSKSCYYHICELRCIRPYLDFKTASTIATSIVHSKLDYCNSLSQTSKLST